MRSFFVEILGECVNEMARPQLQLQVVVFVKNTPITL